MREALPLHSTAPPDPGALCAALADPTRLRSVLLLAGAGELCVCDLVRALDLAQPTVSRHLARLRRDRIVDIRRAARWVHYRLADDLPHWALAMIEAARSGAEGRPPFAADAGRLGPAAGACT